MSQHCEYSAFLRGARSLQGGRLRFVLRPLYVADLPNFCSFRWLSKKYPKLVTSVIEEQPVQVPGPDGEVEFLVRLPAPSCNSPH